MLAFLAMFSAVFAALALFAFSLTPFTLYQQVRLHCLMLGWDDITADDCASLAVELAGSNRRLEGEQLRKVLVESCYDSREAWA